MQIWVRNDRQDLVRRAMRWRRQDLDEAEFGDRLELFAYRRDELTPERTMLVHLGWEVAAETPSPISAELWLLGQDRAQWSLGPTAPLTSSAGDSAHWRRGTAHLTMIPALVPGGMAPGNYQLQLRLVDADGSAIPVRVDRRERLDGVVTLGRVALR
jgi:hypothetical protein